jgi:hypothetical protein
VDETTNSAVMESTAITDGYMQKQAREEAKFRHVLLSDSRLAPLADWILNPKREISTDVEGKPIIIFYSVCVGQRSNEKRDIIKKSMIKYYIEFGYKKDVGLYQPNSLTTNLKTLFGIFHKCGILIELLAHHLPKSGTQSVTRRVARE